MPANPLAYLLPAVTFELLELRDGLFMNCNS